VYVAAALVVATTASVLLRTVDLHAGFWIDEAIAVGIASHDVADIPGLLRQDGSPPLYYLLLHGWMALAGDGEAAARSLSLLFAGMAVPVSWWAGTAVGGRCAGAVAAAVAAGSPFLSYYAQEARMYTLVVLLSLVATAAFVLAFVGRRRVHLATLGVSLLLLLYTHTWGLFLAVALAVAAVVARVDVRDAAAVAAAVSAFYAPWVPSLAFQVRHTGAPWSERPSVIVLAVALALAAVAWRTTAGNVRLLAVVAATGAALAWFASQVEPAWSPRYLAVLYGPVVLAVACGVARRPRWAVAAVVVGALGLVAVPLPEKSNARAVAVSAGVGLRPRDLVISTQPEQLPVLHRYLPPGAVYLTPLGTPADPSVMDWRDALSRLRRSDAPLPPLRAVRRVVLVTRVGARRARSPWSRAVHRRTVQWRAALRRDPRLRRLGATSRPAADRFRSAVRAEVFEVRPVLRSPRVRGRAGRTTTAGG
jgi:mannosyltransferase